MRKIICTLICILVAVASAGCSIAPIKEKMEHILSNKSSEEVTSIYSEEITSNYCGKWVLNYIQKDGLTIDLCESDISSDDIPYIMLNDDGTAVIKIANETSPPGKWTQNENGITLEGCEIVIKDGQLFMETEDFGMLIFVKSSDRSSKKKNISEDTSSSFGENLSDFYGTWEPVSLIYKGYKAEITDAEAAGFDNIYIIFKKDGVACINYKEQYQETTWTKNKSGIILEQGNQQMKLCGDKLCIETDNGYKYYLAKTSSITYPAETDEDYIRPEFKELMDQYEAFFDDYIAFMQKYANASSDDPMAVLGMLQDYLDWLEKYSEVMEDFENVGSSDMTRAESFYYAEVALRIEEKLLKVIE